LTFNGLSDPERMARFVAGNRLFTESLYHRMRGESGQSTDAIRRAIKANPEDREYRFLLELYH
jgi:hypothetical protein